MLLHNTSETSFASFQRPCQQTIYNKTPSQVVWAKKYAPFLSGEKIVDDLNLSPKEYNEEASRVFLRIRTHGNNKNYFILRCFDALEYCLDWWEFHCDEYLNELLGPNVSHSLPTVCKQN